jgi:hypothetical protein
MDAVSVGPRISIIDFPPRGKSVAEHLSSTDWIAMTWYHELV